jgi:nucleoporin SEH1
LFSHSTILSSTGNDGKVRLWKATDGGKVWRAAGSISVEQAPEGEAGKRTIDNADKDVDMGS